MLGTYREYIPNNIYYCSTMYIIYTPWPFTLCGKTEYYDEGHNIRIILILSIQTQTCTSI